MMLSEQLLSELHKLNHAEKLRVVQLLVNELASDEALLTEAFPTGARYEVWSPYESASAAQQLLELLEEDKQTHPSEHGTS